MVCPGRAVLRIDPGKAVLMVCPGRAVPRVCPGKAVLIEFQVLICLFWMCRFCIIFVCVNWVSAWFVWRLFLSRCSLGLYDLGEVVFPKEKYKESTDLKL